MGADLDLGEPCPLSTSCLCGTAPRLSYLSIHIHGSSLEAELFMLMLGPLGLLGDPAGLHLCSCDGAPVSHQRPRPSLAPGSCNEHEIPAMPLLVFLLVVCLSCFLFWSKAFFCSVSVLSFRLSLSLLSFRDSSYFVVQESSFLINTRMLITKDFW